MIFPPIAIHHCDCCHVPFTFWDLLLSMGLAAIVFIIVVIITWYWCK